MSEFRPDIWRLQAQLNTQGLVDALTDENDHGIRKRAAAALRALGAVDAIPALQAALEQESEPETRSHILAALAGLQQENERRAQRTGDTQEQPIVTETDRLIADLRTGDEQAVIEAARVLGEQRVKESVVPLVIRFNDPETPIRVRLAVAEALLKLESAPVEVALLGALRSDEWRVRRNAAAILGQLRAEWAIEPLSQALGDEKEIIRKTALAALKSIGTQEARDAARAATEAVKRATAEAEAAQKAAAADTADADSDEEALIDLEPPQSFTDDEDAIVVDKPQRPSQPNDETQKIVWPRRQRKREKPVNPTLAPTRPLDPNILKRSQAQNNPSGPSQGEDNGE